MNTHLIITELSIDFIKMIREIDQEVPIIILSNRLDTNLLYKSINHEVQGYLKKPINENTLTTKINNIKKRMKQGDLNVACTNISDTAAIIAKIDTEGTITYVNKQFCDVSGFTEKELVGEHYNSKKLHANTPSFYSTLWDTIKNKKEIWTGLLKQKHKNDELYYLKTTIEPIMDSNDNIIEFITLSILVTDMIEQEKQLNDYLKQQRSSILLLIKIEEFRYLEHSFTQKITRKLQNLFARELLKHLPQECQFSKIYVLNNGQFAFVKKHEKNYSEAYLSEIIQDFQQQVNQKKIKIGIVDYSLSIVCSLASGTHTLVNAQIGLKELEKTKADFIIASNLLEEATRKSNAKLNKFIMLKEAIDSYNIISYFQPIINNETLKVEKYESLVRLIDQERNIITPYHFLEISKEGNYYHKITSIVLRNSFQALFYTDMQISVNLSALDLEDKPTTEYSLQLLEEYKTESHRIMVELVEDEKIRNKQEIHHFIEAIKKYGVQIALDDFGKGFSNFTRIQSYQPNYIKIDGSLIRDIETNALSRDLVETIVFFAKKQNIKTIAEFVENENIYNILKDLGVDYSQGYHFGKAALLDEFDMASF